MLCEEAKVSEKECFLQNPVPIFFLLVFSISVSYRHYWGTILSFYFGLEKKKKNRWYIINNI